ncbi:hypothetical protein TNCV_3904141 [Trichonephila clavipes]|nr:hypothetical protein TNCV_3904141 [Trichonephila clavipes]
MGKFENEPIYPASKRARRVNGSRGDQYLYFAVNFRPCKWGFKFSCWRSVVIWRGRGCPASESFETREKDGNRLVSGPDYMVDPLKLPNQAPELLESHYRRVAWLYPDGTHLFCWPVLVVSGQSLASNGPVDNRDLNLVFGLTE